MGSLLKNCWVFFYNGAMEAFANMRKKITSLASSAEVPLPVPRQSDCGAALLEELTQKHQNHATFLTKSIAFLS